MKLYSYDTNETIDEDASPELRNAACDSETPVLGAWNDGNKRWELIDEQEASTLRACGVDRIEKMYGLP